MNIFRPIFRCAFTLVLMLSAGECLAQRSVRDSLSRAIEEEKSDTARLRLKLKLGELLLLSDPSVSLQLARESAMLAREAKQIPDEVAAISLIGHHFYLTANYPQALSQYLRALKMSEKPAYRLRYGQLLNNIGNTYLLQSDFEPAIRYYHAAKKVGEDAGSYSLVTRASCSLGDAYEKSNRLDSAMYYTQLTHQRTIKADPYLHSLSLNNLGNIYRKMKKFGLALEYYRQAVALYEELEDGEGLTECFLGMARIFGETGVIDSSRHYAMQSLQIAEKNNYLTFVSESSFFLHNFFKTKGQSDSALHYLGLNVSAKDSIFSRDRLAQFQDLTFSEEMRQQEIALQQKASDESRRTNAQYLILGITVVVLILLFLLLSKTFIIHEKWISFLGILALLLAFEFFNLVLHNFIAALTDHNPFLMLIGLVVLASLIIPFHHRIEKWVRGKVVLKNKKMRLSAARKTVERLENEVQN